jgi:hypothetical protein
MFTVLVLGASFGALAHSLFDSARNTVLAQQAASSPDVTALAAEMNAIKGKLPDQAHAMQDVGYHFSNLWFAGRAQNWPLAGFYNQEVLSHLKWAVRIIPKRKDLAGAEIDLEAILQAFENSPWTQMKEAIASEDAAGFDKSYRFMLETCYACHKASDKPFIRLQIPTEPESPIIHFDPAAE